VSAGNWPALFGGAATFLLNPLEPGHAATAPELAGIRAKTLSPTITRSKRFGAKPLQLDKRRSPYGAELRASGQNALTDRYTVKAVWSEAIATG
jgi:hypothetical protein